MYAIVVTIAFVIGKLRVIAGVNLEQYHQ